VKAAVTRYRVMVYIVGVLFNALVFIGLPLQYAAGQQWVSAGWTAHGLLYIVYLAAAFDLTRRLRLSPVHTVIVLLAGTIPVMTFVVERWVTRRFLAPAGIAGPARTEGTEGTASRAGEPGAASAGAAESAGQA
jgi:integral membrane protein